MEFLEIERRNETKAFNMSYTQFHDYYELYFLLSGEREFFIESKLFLLQSGSFCIVPPFLQNISEQCAFVFNRKQLQFIIPLLKEASEVETADASKKRNFILSFIKTVIAYIQTQMLTPLTPTGTLNSPKHSDTLILQIVAYINKEYQQKLTLDMLAKKFYLSKNTLCKRFRDQMNCSPIQYAVYTRLNKAKMYLSSTDKNVSEIAELCGFPSANYMGIIFKKQIGISPLNYRKKQ